jgi:PBP1b-binding outer membrane lipoprotein LpoB
MFRKLSLVLALSMLAALLLAGCDQSEPQTQTKTQMHAEGEAVITPDPETIEAQNDFRDAYNAYEEAEGDEAKQLELLEGYLAKHPDRRYSGQAMVIVAKLMHKDDHNAFTNELAERLKNVTNMQARDFVIVQAGMAYRDNDDFEGLKAFITAAGVDVELSSNSHLLAASAALKTDDFNFLKLHTDAALAKANADSLKVELAGVQQTEAQIQAHISRIRGEALVNRARYLGKENKVDEALADLEAAATSLDFNLVGVVYGNDINTLWTNLLIQKGDFAGAMNRIAPDAIFFGEDEGAIELYKQAYLANGGNEANLKAAMEAHRLELAPTIPDFTAMDYAGNEVTFAGLKGKVTLLTAWFPT